MGRFKAYLGNPMMELGVEASEGMREPWEWGNKIGAMGPGVQL
jgi:hypothetical protein